MLVSVKNVFAPTDNGTFTDNMRWWLRVCFIIGLPWSESPCRWFVKLFAFAFLVGDLAIGLTALAAITNSFTYSTGNTNTERLSSVIIFYDNFTATSVLHAIAFSKLNELHFIMCDFNHFITIDVKLKRLLRIATVSIILYILGTQCFTNLLSITINITVFDVPKLPRTVFWLLWSSLQAYPIIIGYTIALLIATLGYQFALLRKTISSQTLVPWENAFERYIKLSKLAGKLQKCVSVPLMILFSHALINLCTTTFFIVDFLMNDTHVQILWSIVFALEICVRCTCMCVAADYVKDQANSIVLQLAEADVKLHHSRYEKDILRGFSINLRNLSYLSTFSVGGFCRLSKSLLLAMSAAIASYLVLLCQIRGNESHGDTHL